MVDMGQLLDDIGVLEMRGSLLQDLLSRSSPKNRDVPSLVEQAHLIGARSRGPTSQEPIKERAVGQLHIGDRPKLLAQ